MQEPTQPETDTNTKPKSAKNRVSTKARRDEIKRKIALEDAVFEAKQRADLDAAMMAGIAAHAMQGMLMSAKSLAAHDMVEISFGAAKELLTRIRKHVDNNVELAKLEAEARDA